MDGLKKSKARRRVRTRVALFLSLASLAGLALLRLLGAALHVTGLSAVALSTAGTLLCFLLPALAGLFMLDGDQHRLIALRALSAQHTLCLAAAGALFVGPSALLAALPDAFLRLCGAELAQTAAAAPDAALFLPMLLQSALLAPICEELFFRGYLMGAFARAGRGKAVAAAALLFAAAHGVDAAFLPRFLFGCLLGLMARRTGSILAPMLMHGCYNAAVLMIGFSGVSLGGSSLLFCALGLLSAALCFAMVARVYLARANRAPVDWGGALNGREIAKVAVSVLAVIAAVIITGVTKP